jgi:hypothetical protein
MEYQVKNLQQIFDEARFSPVFRENPKYNIEGVARIDYDDIMNDRCIIKADKNFPDSGSFWVGKGAEIIAQYKSVQDLVDDGWRLD